MTDLSLGLVAPHAGRAASPDALREAADRAEELGLHSLWVGDHIVLPSKQETPYPYRSDSDDEGAYLVPSQNAFFEAFQTLAFLAAHTSTVHLGISVGILPYRHPLLWAKSVGTLAALSNDRVILGVGAGWLEEEFRALGLDYSARGATADATLRLLREVWDGTDGRVVVNDVEVQVVPRFGQRPPAVWVGGTGARARRRAGHFGAVWHPMMRACPPEVIARREDPSSPVALYVTYVAQQEVGPEMPWESNEVHGPVEYLAEVVDQYREAGVTHVVLSTGGSTRRRFEVVEALTGLLT